MSTLTPSAFRMILSVSGCVHRSLTNLDLEATLRRSSAPLPNARAQFSSTSARRMERRYARTPSHERKENGLLPAVRCSSPGSVMPRSAKVNVLGIVRGARWIFESVSDALSRQKEQPSIQTDQTLPRRARQDRPEIPWPSVQVSGWKSMEFPARCLSTSYTMKAERQDSQLPVDVA